MRLRSDISVELEGEQIVVSEPGTVFLIAFAKAPNQRRLVITRSWLSDFTTKPLLEFRARAAQLALNKARSLGWIVEAAIACQRPKSVAVSPSISTAIR
jgi:hypothetical protein